MQNWFTLPNGCTCLASSRHWTKVLVSFTVLIPVPLVHMLPSSATTTIYIVDDEASVRRALKRVFSTAGFTVLTFESAEEYLQQSASQTQSCLVLDLHLRGMSGLELLEMLRKNHRAIPTVVITAHDEENIRAQVLKAGAGFLVKPIKETVLMEAVQQALK